MTDHVSTHAAEEDARIASAATACDTSHSYVVGGVTTTTALYRAALVAPEVSGNFDRILGWADKVRRLKVRANADQPDQAEIANVFLDEVRDVVVPHEQHVERHVLAVAHQLVLAAAELQAAAGEQVERQVGESARLLHRDAQALLSRIGWAHR